MIGDVPSTYKKRQGIENACKPVKNIRSMTTSKKHSIMMFLMFISRVRCNLYITNYEIEAAAMKSRTRHVKRRMAQAMFMAYVAWFALNLMMTDMDKMNSIYSAPNSTFSSSDVLFVIKF